MATLAGVFYFDERPTEGERRWIVASLQPLAPDGVSMHAADGLVMAHGACHVWTGEADTAQPLRSASGLVLTWDGRLDNRDDLCLRLDGRLAAPETSDADLALRVFERWGVDGLRDLIGDWALVIWDPAARTLHLARDYMGVRPLYYHADRQGVMWSSSLGELAVRSGRYDDLSDEYVARFMALCFSTDVTPYRGVRGAPTGTCTSFDADGGERRTRFWSLRTGDIRYRDPRDYEVRLRELWAEAVGARLRTDRPVWAELSGGLDSSSVVCMADALIRAGRVVAPDLRLMSQVTLHSPEGDERRFIAAIEQWSQRASEVIGIEATAGLRADWHWVSPRAWRGVQIAEARIVRSNNSRIVLTGQGGDLVMGCQPDNSLAVFDDLADGAWPRAGAQLRRWSRTTRTPIVMLAWTLARAAIARRPARAIDMVDQDRQESIGVLSPHLRSMLERSAWDVPCATEIRRAHRETGATLALHAVRAHMQTDVEGEDLAFTHPFFHRPLVDYMLGIPAEQLSAPGDMRSLMRRAFAELVPARVLQRISKGYYPPGTMRHMRPAIEALLPAEHCAAVRRGWLAASPLQTAVERALSGAASTVGALYCAVRLEQWLRARERQGPAATPKGKEVTTNDVLIA